MSLNFDLTAIPVENRTIVAERDGNAAMGEDFKKGDRIMSPITNALIWSTLGVGIGEITEDNAEEFYARLRMQQKLFGAELRRSDGTPYFISYDEVRRHIGLKTNVFPKRSDADWLKQTLQSHRDEVRREIAKAATDAETARLMGV